MLWKGNDRDYYRVVDVFSTVSWWRFDLPEGILPQVQRTRDADEALVTLLDANRWLIAGAVAELRPPPRKE